MTWVWACDVGRREGWGVLSRVSWAMPVPPRRVCGRGPGRVALGAAVSPPRKLVFVRVAWICVLNLKLARSFRRVIGPAASTMRSSPPPPTPLRAASPRRDWALRSPHGISRDTSVPTERVIFMPTKSRRADDEQPSSPLTERPSSAPFRAASPRRPPDLPVPMRQWAHVSPTRPSPRLPADYKPTLESRLLSEAWSQAWDGSGRGRTLSLMAARQASPPTSDPGLPSPSIQCSPTRARAAAAAIDSQDANVSMTPSSLIRAHLRHVLRDGFDPAINITGLRRQVVHQAVAKRPGSYMADKGNYASLRAPISPHPGNYLEHWVRPQRQAR